MIGNGLKHGLDQYGYSAKLRFDCWATREQ
jgi:hypothetical protein